MNMKWETLDEIDGLFERYDQVVGTLSSDTLDLSPDSLTLLEQAKLKAIDERDFELAADISNLIKCCVDIKNEIKLTIME
jgi:hypothetical protein